MNFLLVAINAQFIHTNLAVRYIKSYLQQQAEIAAEIAEFTINNRQEYVLKELFLQNADVYMFSCYIWNIDMICDVAKELKKIKPTAVFVAGGPQVTYNSEEFLCNNKAFDFVVSGEGEEACLQLCKALQNKKDVKHCLNVYYRKDEAIAKTNRSTPFDMENLPFTYENPDEFKGRIIYYESMRGCPFKCSYCLSSADEGVRYKSINKVFGELEILLSAKPKQVKFVDRTFNCNKKRAMEIWKFLHEHDNGTTNFHFELAGEILTNDMLMFLAKVRQGLFQFEIGVQTTNTSTLQEINRVSQLPVLFDNVKKLQKPKNIHLHLDLIAGLPNEDFNSFKKSFNDVMSLSPHQMQLGFLKVLPGTQMQKSANKYGLVWQSKAPFEFLYTKWLSYKEVVQLKNIEEMVDLYYNSGRFAHILEFIGKYFNDDFSFWQSLAEFYYENGHAKTPLSKIGYYDLLGTFLQAKQIEISQTAKWLCRFDIILHEKPKVMPKWVDVDGSRPNRQRALLFYENKKNVAEFLPEYENINAKQLLNMAHIEVFPFNLETLAKEEYCLLINYKKRDIAGKALCRQIKLPLC